MIDQFEELFTLVNDEAVRGHFLESLVTAVLDPRSHLRVVITMRADFMDRPLQYVDFGELLRQRLALVLPLTPDELTRAITGPIESLGMSMQPTLVATIIREVGNQPGMLPLLQYALTELFEQRSGQILRLKDYRDAGGVTSALSRRANEIYESLDPTSQEAARQLFLRLVTLGEGVEDTRRRVLLAELEALEIAGEQARTEQSRSGSGGAEEKDRIVNASTSLSTTLQSSIVNHFGQHRLLTFDHDPVTRGPTVEVAHEALLREWPRLRKWLRDSREDVRRQRELAAQAQQWQVNNQDESYLLRGSRLTSFDAWVETTTLAFTTGEQSFLQASLSAREARLMAEETRRRRELETIQQLAQEQTQRAEEQARSAQRLRIFAAGLAVVLLIAIGAAWLAIVRGQEAETNLVESERSRLALQAQNALDRGEGGDLSFLLAMRSLQLGYSPEADQALQSALTTGFPRQVFIGHTDDVQYVDFSPDGRQIASVSIDGTVRLWDVQTGQEIKQFFGHQATTLLIDFSPDGRFLVTTSSDRTVRLWDIQTGQEISQFAGDGLGSGIDFSSDGKKMLIANPGKVEIRAVPSSDIIFEFNTDETDTGLVAQLSPDGNYIITSPVRGQVKLWDAHTGTELRLLTGHVGWVGWAVFSPDSQYVLTTGQDGTGRIWDVETGNELRRFVGHSDAIFNGFFSPDGKYVVTGSYDKTARVWDVASGRELERFSGHTDFVSVAFSPNSQMIATASGDRTIKLWDIHTEHEPRQMVDFSLDHLQEQIATTISADGQFTLVGRLSGVLELINNQTQKTILKIETGDFPVTTFSFSPDNRLIISGDDVGVVKLWDGQTGEQLWQFVGHDEAMTAVTFSPDGRFILTASKDRTARLLETETGRELQSLTGLDGGVFSAAFSPDGTRILTGGEDTIIRLWDAVNGQELAQFIGHTGPVHAVTFAPDGRSIVSGSADNTARLWDLATSKAVQTFVGHTDLILRAAFSPDGRFIITGSEDQTARLWDVATGKEVHQYTGHISPVFHVGFSADGQRVYTADSQAAYVWRTTLNDVIAFACEQLNRDFTDAEREFYGITGSVPTCPAAAIAQIQPTWTPYATSAAPVVGPSLVTELEFIPVEVANVVAMSLPVQHVYISDGPDTVIRPLNFDPTILNEPLFSAAEPISDTLAPPFDLGPFPKGQPLGFTLNEWNAAEGHGTYTLTGSRARLDLTFDHLVPNGVYTLWCVTLQFVPEFAVLEELACGPLDGSENTIIADENGHAVFQLEMEPFPVSTEEFVYELAVAYHSDGLTHGSTVGEFGMNAHTQMVYDFLPPE